MTPDYGYWEVSIEKSGRLKLPASLLQKLPEDERKSFYVTHGFGEYIMLWSEKAYRKQMEYMNSLAETVYLKASPEVLAMHLRMGKIERPLIKGKTDEELLQYIKDSLQVREPYYTQARHTLDVTLLDNYDKIKISVQLLREQLGV